MNLLLFDVYIALSFFFFCLVAFTGLEKPILIWEGHQSVGLLVQHTLLKAGEIRLLRCFSV